MLSQAEILDILRQDGYDVGLRTLRYWRSVGLLPRLYGRKYSIDVIDNIKDLCNRFGRLIGDTIFIHILEGYHFKVYRYIVEKPKEYQGNFRLTLYTDKGIIIERRSSLGYELFR